MEWEGHIVAVVVDAAAALEKCRTGTWDLMILDAGGDASGACALCRSIRLMSGMGILVLFRDGGGQSRIDALNSGADDYLTGSFVPAELHARVRAILRRIGKTDEVESQVLLKDRAIDLGSRRITGPGSQSTHLTPKEYLVLKYLVTRPDKPVYHRELAQTVWKRDGSGDLEYVRIVIGQLRRKIERDYSSPQYILTERSIGYRFTVSADRSDTQAMAR
jgi:two-component system alkaline phosphatase synthesis response regulator PhoP